MTAKGPYQSTGYGKSSILLTLNPFIIKSGESIRNFHLCFIFKICLVASEFHQGVYSLDKQLIVCLGSKRTHADFQPVFLLI